MKLTFLVAIFPSVFGVVFRSGGRGRGGGGRREEGCSGILWKQLRLLLFVYNCCC